MHFILPILLLSGTHFIRGILGAAIPATDCDKGDLECIAGGQDHAVDPNSYASSVCLASLLRPSGEVLIYLLLDRS